MREFRKPDNYFTGGFKKERHASPFDKENVYIDRLLGFRKLQKHVYAGLTSDAPFLVGRIGSTEGKILGQVFLGSGDVTNEPLRMEAQRNSGIFPTDDVSLRRFAFEYMQAVLHMDVSALWNFSGAAELAAAFPVEKYGRLEDLTPFPKLKRGNKLVVEGKYVPWTKALEGKRVLVVHPFEKSIREQFKRMGEIESVRDIMPEFGLETLQPPVTFLNTDLSDRRTFFDELQATREKMAKINFDIAIVSAGAYGLPLAAFAKMLGRKAVHIGGAGQLLFGISGARWEDNPRFKDVLGENWVRPSEDEKVPGSEALKNVYW